MDTDLTQLLTSDPHLFSLFTLNKVFLSFNQHSVTVLKGSGLIVGAAHYCVPPVIFDESWIQEGSREGSEDPLLDLYAQLSKGILLEIENRTH